MRNVSQLSNVEQRSTVSDCVKCCVVSEESDSCNVEFDLVRYTVVISDNVF